MSKTLTLGFFTVLFVSAAVQAETAQPQDTTSVQVESLYQTPTQTEKLKRDAHEWGISGEDYTRYEALMKGRRGIQSPGLDPLTALGIEARTDAERRQYAEKWVRQEYQRTEKELAFQREVDAAWRRLYGSILPVNLGQTVNMPQKADGRLALFVRLEECASCDAKLIAILAKKQPVDIYVLGTNGNDDRLRDWAKQKKIPVERVKRREITLNHDAGLSLKYGLTTAPTVLQQATDGHWRAVAD
ncbi:TIGR03759 family integrating conjugative element protein [Providencia rettgeri]|uniref:TIGR03759 family integrating conjugative element protein n=1 Tax=Providencia rettgeri TaxID=587 RepID=UPI00200AA554|nr:TIGR03759 family integrating conjugative element protein [Providencia rettgeri]UPQ40166.1 TIGR03759 family integrating conjugative element protein [Providencia rettgeri]